MGEREEYPTLWTGSEHRTPAETAALLATTAAVVSRGGGLLVEASGWSGMVTHDVIGDGTGQLGACPDDLPVASGG